MNPRRSPPTRTRVPSDGFSSSGVLGGWSAPWPRQPMWRSTTPGCTTTRIVGASEARGRPWAGPWPTRNRAAPQGTPSPSTARTGVPLRSRGPPRPPPQRLPGRRKHHQAQSDLPAHPLHGPGVVQKPDQRPEADSVHGLLTSTMPTAPASAQDGYASRVRPPGGQGRRGGRPDGDRSGPCAAPATGDGDGDSHTGALRGRTRDFSGSVGSRSPASGCLGATADEPVVRDRRSPFRPAREGLMARQDVDPSRMR